MPYHYVSFPSITFATSSWPSSQPASSSSAQEKLKDPTRHNRNSYLGYTHQIYDISIWHPKTETKYREINKHRKGLASTQTHIQAQWVG